MTNIEQVKSDRYKFLKELYDATEGDELNWYEMTDIGRSLGFTDSQTTKITNYLVGEHLVQFRALGGIIGITHHGIKEIEDAESNPDRPSRYFPPVNIINIGHMENSQIQQSGQGSSQSIEISQGTYDDIGELITEISEKIEDLQLPAQAISDLNADIESIRGQLKSSRPKPSVISECLISVKGILESATASAFALPLIEKIASLLGLGI